MYFKIWLFLIRISKVTLIPLKMNGQGGNIHLLPHHTIYQRFEAVDLLFLSINILFNSRYTKNVGKMEFKYECCEASMLIQCNAVLQNAVWGENGSDTLLLLPPLRSAARRENNMPQLNAGPGYSETWISWSCQLCFQFRIKQDLKIYICTKVPSSILQISITGYRSSLPHSIKTFVEIIIFYWPEWNLVKNDKNKIIFCAIFADSVAAVSVHQLCPRFQILMIKFAFHCIAIAVVRLLGRVPGPQSLYHF